jgi:recombination protein RecT
MANNLQLVEQQKLELENLLIKYRQQMINALPKHIPVERLVRLVLTEFTKNPSLWGCDLNSFIGAVLNAAQMGLEIGILGQGFLVPYYDKKTNKKIVQFIPGWQGLLSLVYREGRAQVWTGAVYEGDEFDFALGTNPYIRHIPCGESNPDKLKYVYAVADLKGFSKPLIEVWPISKVWAHRDKINKVGENHYSYQFKEQYARKVVLLALLDYVPRSVELSEAIKAEYAAAEGRAVVLEDIISTPVIKTTPKVVEANPVEEATDVEVVEENLEKASTNDTVKTQVGSEGNDPEEENIVNLKNNIKKKIKNKEPVLV